MYMAELAVAVVAGGLGFVVADGLDRFLATYNPGAVAAGGTAPTNKFTSDGAGTLANTLNVASPPGFARIGASVAVTALPAVASMFVENSFVRSGLEGMAIGGGVKLFSLFWNNFLMPMLKPKTTDNASLQKSFIARLYPAEVAAAINLHDKPPTTAATGVTFGALSQPADVGPFALQGPGAEAASGELFPTTAEALRRQAGMSDQFPTLQNVWGTGMSTPGEPPGIAGLGDGLGGIFDDISRTVSSFMPGLPVQHVAQAAGHVVSAPHDIAGALTRTFPHVPGHVLHECARHLHPHVARLAAVRPVAQVMRGMMGQTPAAGPAPTAAAAAPTTAPATLPTAATAPAAAPVVPLPVVPLVAPGQPVGWQPGPPSTFGPGPQSPRMEPTSAACACLGEGEQYAGYLGDPAPQDDSLFYSVKAA